MINKNFFVNQTSVNDCGAACLAMLLKIRGVKTSLEEIKSKMDFTEEGVSAYDIVNAAKEKGLILEGYKNVSLENIKVPAIIHLINENNTQHFVVLLKVLKNKVLIADPARKATYIDKDELLNKYTRIALMPKDEFNIKNEILKNKWLVLKILFVTFFLVFLNVIFSCQIPVVLKMINNDKENLGLLLLICFFVIGIFKDILSYIRSIMLINFKIITDRFITIPTINKIISLPHNFYHKRGSGELISKVNDLSYIKEVIFSIVEVIIINLLLVLISVIIISFIDINFLFINIIYILILYLLNKSFLKKHLNKTYDLQLSNEKLNQQLVDTFNSVNMIKNLSKENYFINKITNLYNNILTKYRKITHLYLKKELISSIFISFLSVFILLFSIMRLDNISNILFVTSMQNVIINSLNEVLSLFSSYADFKSALKRVKVIFDEKTMDNTSKFINIKNIHFNNVSYKFRGDFIFKNVNLDIKKGDWIMVNGKTASGKSTLFKLLCKHYDIKDNNIFINSVNIKNIDDNIIRNSIIYVDQKIRLFNLSIRENIFSGSKFNKKVIKTALINETLKENNMTLDDVIDNGSANLSAGAANKIAIAQALALNKDVIIFDETTSNLDIKTENIILNNIKNNYKDKTIILITHRKSNIKYFNKIITLENGNLIINKGGVCEKVKN